MEVRNFEVAVPEADVDAMYARLRDARWPSDLGNDSWRYGVNRAWLEDLVTWWRIGRMKAEPETARAHPGAHRTDRDRGAADPDPRRGHPFG